MAERVDGFDFGMKGRRKYPWNEWLDGSTWCLTRGEDFDVEIQSMRTMAHIIAKERGGTVRCKKVGDKLYMQFTKDAAVSLHQKRRGA